MATSTLPTNWTQADFDAWFAPIYADLTEERIDYIYARTPDELELNVFEYLATGATSSPLPRGWTNPEFVEWITLLINDALAEYNSQVVSLTPPALLPAVRERLNINQPPPTTDLITGGSGQTPGVPGTPGVLPAGATLTRASVANYWEGSNWIRNWSMVGAVVGSPGTTPTNWSMSGAGGPFNNITRTIVGFGTEDGIPYLDIQYAGTPSASSGSGITSSYEPAAQIVAAPGQIWTGSVYFRLMAGTVPAAGFQQIVRDADVAGATLGTTSLVARFPTNAALRSQQFTITRTLVDPGTVRTSHTFNIPYSNGVAINFVLRIGMPMMTTTSIPFVPQLYQVNNDTPRFTVDPITGVLQGLLNEPTATNSLRNSAGLGASGSTQPTNWSAGSTISGITKAYTSGITEDGIPCVDVRVSGTPGTTSSVANVVEFEQRNFVVAAQGETWTGSLFCRLMAGNLTNTVLSFVGVREFDSAGNPLAQLATIPITPTNAALRTQRTVVTRTLTNPTVGCVSDYLTYACTIGLPIDFTVRLFPQLVKDTIATSPIITSTVAVTRAADLFNAPLAAGTYSMAVARVSGTTTYPGQSATAGKWLVPVDPSPVRSVAATATSIPAITYDFMPGTLPSGVTLTRGSAGWTFGPTGVLTSFATDVPRFRYDPSTLTLQGLLNEPVAVNQIRNSSATGAVNGSPGTPPTNWSPTGAGVFNGLSRTIVGTGIEDGIPYLDVSYSGLPTATASITISFESNTQIVAANGETWVGTVWLRLMAGTIPVPGLGTTDSVEQLVVERNAAGSSTSIERTPRYPTGAALRTQRFDLVHANTNPATARVSQSLTINYSIGNPVSFTLRIGLPQLVLAAAPLSPIVTSSVAVTRAVDILTAAQANLAPGFWNAVVKRVSGTRTYSIDLTAGGNIGYVIPPDPSPVQSLKLEMAR